jgi:magnesium-transporting ATPase (P-type)
MGGRGTDVARESSSLVLLDDNFTSIVRAVRMGRRVFDNLKKAMAYIFAVHVPIAGMSLIPVLLQWPLVFLPVHIVFMELIIDPACSFVFEAEPAESNVMKRPPRNPKGGLFNRRMIGLSLLQGFSVLAILVAVYAIALLRGNGEDDARALTFTTLIVANLGLILVNRSWSRTAGTPLTRTSSSGSASPVTVISSASAVSCPSAPLSTAPCRGLRIRNMAVPPFFSLPTAVRWGLLVPAAGHPTRSCPRG